MKSLRTLLKLAQRDLDTLRRALGTQFARQADCVERIRGHDQTIASEQLLAQRDYESARAYGGYAVAALATRRALDAELALIDQEIEGLRAQIAAAHVEVRKFERLIELDEARQKLRRDKREHAEMDELAIQRAASKR